MNISTKAASRAGRDWAVVTVCDTGVGIPHLDLARIFEPFYTTKGNQGGTGLGLSIVKHIAENHGGRVTAESTFGEGSTFTVYLPRS
jgi:signal transduction histidine kinase